MLVATDVVGRGIDVTTISHIINYDVPQFCDDYVHRVGRTGRMGREGVAFTFVSPEEGNELTRIEMRINRLLKRDEIPGFVALAKPQPTEDFDAESGEPLEPAAGEARLRPPHPPHPPGAVGCVKHASSARHEAEVPSPGHLPRQRGPMAHPSDRISRISNLSVPCGTDDLDPLADLLADQPLGQGTGQQNLAGVVILLAGADQRELLLVAEVEVLHPDRRAEGHLVLGELGGVQQDGPRELVAEHVDAGLHQRPALLGAGVLGVLGQIALRAGVAQPFEDFRQLDGVQMIEVGLELVVAGASHGDAVGHDSPRRKKGRPPPMLGVAGLRKIDRRKWSGGGSNSRPLHCERSALPTELPPR